LQDPATPAAAAGTSPILVYFMELGSAQTMAVLPIGLRKFMVMTSLPICCHDSSPVKRLEKEEKLAELQAQVAAKHAQRDKLAAAAEAESVELGNCFPLPWVFHVEPGKAQGQISTSHQNVCHLVRYL
jgi:hypothetical protein